MGARNLHSSNQEYDDDHESKGRIQGGAMLFPDRFECQMVMNEIPRDIVKPQVDSSKALGIRKNTAR